MSTDTVITLLLTGIATIALSLAVWILNSVSKRVNKLEEKVGENDTRLHGRVDAIITSRMNKWLEKELDCRREDSRITILETILQERLKKEGKNHEL